MLATTTVSTTHTDVLVIGSGAAGLISALSAREAGVAVSIVSRGRLGRGGSTAKAGGILNAVVGAGDPRDSIEQHVADTAVAGRFMSDEPLVRAMAEGIVRAIPRLEAWGVEFAREVGNRPLLIRSAGHSFARTMVLAGRQGTALTKPLVRAVRLTGVDVTEGVVLCDLLVADGRVVGALFLDPDSGELTAVEAPAVVLATGGAGAFYSTNGVPAQTPGDGYAAARRAGCALVDLEFVQFFPTYLDDPSLPRMLVPYDFLLQCGAVLRDSRGTDLAAQFDLPQPNMLTRAELTGAIGRSIVNNPSEPHVYFDWAGFKLDRIHGGFRDHPFFQLIESRREKGQDVLARPTRVRPIVHHFMGGVRVGNDGRTDIEGLFAAGEVAGGTHGANRLAGNAFTEAISSGFRSGEMAAATVGGANRFGTDKQVRRCVDRLRYRTMGSGPRVDEVIDKLRQVLSASVGPCRDAKSCRTGLDALQSLAADSNQVLAATQAERALAPNIRELVEVATLLVASALRREESRGAHLRLDFPAESELQAQHLAHTPGRTEPSWHPVTGDYGWIRKESREGPIQYANLVSMDQE